MTKPSPPLISVLIGVKNAAEKIDLTINSLSRQSLDPSLFEVLVCNDGSTDSTSDRLEEWQKKNACKIVLTNNTSQGLTHSLVELARHASGRYLARADAGDICHPERLAFQLAYLEKNPNVGMVCTTTLLMSPSQKIIGPLFSPLSKEIEIQHLLRKNVITHGSIMMKKEAYESVGGYDSNFKFAQDFDLWTRMADQGIKIHWLKNPLYMLELDETGISATKKMEQAQFSSQIKSRYVKGNAPVPASKYTDMDSMKRNAALRGIPGLGRVFQAMESILFELKCRPRS